MWTWIDSLPFDHVRFYLNRGEQIKNSVLVPCFIGESRLTINWLGSVCGLTIGLVWLDTESSIPPYWRYGISETNWNPLFSQH